MLTPRLVLLATLAGHALASTACQSTSTTRTTSAQQYASGSPELRTVDNSGYVDPGGRTSQVSAGGAGATGRGNGVPPKHQESPSGGATTTPDTTESEAYGPPSASTSADPTEVTQRAARALCDRETYCGRIGAGKAFESADACMASKRERVGRAVSEASCRQIRGERVAQCLTAIRGAACGAAEAPLQPPAACTADALCK